MGQLLDSDANSKIEFSKENYIKSRNNIIECYSITDPIIKSYEDKFRAENSNSDLKIQTELLKKWLNLENPEEADENSLKKAGLKLGGFLRSGKTC